MSLADWYVVAVLLGAGAGIAGFWAVALATRRVDALGEFGATRAGHIAAEYATAALCLTGGIARILDEHGAIANTFAPLGIGALIYAVLQSPGYYRARTPAVVPVLALTGLATIPAIVVLAAGR